MQILEPFSADFFFGKVPDIEYVDRFVDVPFQLLAPKVQGGEGR